MFNIIYSEKDLIKAILLHPAGYYLNLFGAIKLRTTDDKTIEMYVKYHDGEVLPSDAHFVKKNHDGSGHIVTYSWDISEVDAVVKFFLKTREERGIGVDAAKRLWRKRMMESLPEPDTAEGPEPNEAADAEDAYGY
jgi:hypothetical protein